MANAGGFQKCYEARLVEDPSLKGGVTLSLRIGVDGSVEHVSISSSSLGNAEVERCMVETFKALRFRAAGRPTGASFPFVVKGAR